MKGMQEVVLGLGSNVGKREANLEVAIAELEIKLRNKAKRSPIYESEPWGFESNDSFLNCCLIIKTNLPPEELLRVTQGVEMKLGRVKKSKNNIYESRAIDIDILYYGDLIYKSKDLIIPHPLIYDRCFVVRPLSDICPEWIDPVKGKSILQLLERLNDEKSVILYHK